MGDDDRRRGPFDLLGGMLGGLGELVEQLEELKERGEILREGELGEEGDGEGPRARWGVHVRTGLGGPGGASSADRTPRPGSERSDPARPPQEQRSRTVEVGPSFEGAGPRVEVLEEDAGVRVLLEGQDLKLEALGWELDEDLLFLTLTRRPAPWHHELLLPAPGAEVRARQGHGVLELEIPFAADDDTSSEE